MTQKNAASINFALGMETKLDPKQVQIGNFLSLENTVFDKGGLLDKRYGYKILNSLPDSSFDYLSTYSGNLMALGHSIQARANGSNKWINKGLFQPLDVSVLPTVRSALSQTQCDSVVSSNGYVCTVFTEQNNGVSAYKYTVQDSATGQSIVNPTAIPVSSGAITGSPRVFILGSSFIIVFTNTISSVNHLQYVAISAVDPTITVKTNTDIASAYDPAASVAWDGVVSGTNLYISYNTSSGGQQIKVVFLTQQFVLSAAQSFVGSIATIVAMCVDQASLVVYAAFFDAASNNGYVVALDQNLNKLMTPTQILSFASPVVTSMTCSAISGVVNVFYEAINSYSFVAVRTDQVFSVPVTLPATVTTGSLGSVVTVLLSAGIASKSFIMNGTIYLLGAYQSTLQSTYFLSDSSGNIIGRFAYENGGGYLNFGLPQAQVDSDRVYIGYLFKDLIETIAPSLGSQGAPIVSNVYSQTGVNLLKVGFNSDSLSVSEIGNNLNISGGMLWSYDGQTISEQNFNLFPDNVVVAQVSDPTPTGTVTNTSTTISAMSSVAGIVAGMTVTDTTNPSSLPAGTTVLSVGASSVVISAAATATHAGDSLKFVGNVSAQQYYYQVTYEWTDAQGNIFRSAPSIPVTVTNTTGHTSNKINVPTLRLTYKSGIKIVIYRWSAAQETYYQITSLQSPIINDKNSDSISFVDLNSDSQILGNNIIYTNGGVIEDLAGPASTATTLFDDRLWLIDAEDQNLLWYSKQVIESTPVEMSDVLTQFIAPSTGSQGSTGPMKCLAPLDEKLIIFKASAIYYINGSGPDNTGANSQYSQPIFITATVGCSNQRSIVFIPSGLMFQSEKGIWLLGRDLSTTYIGAPVERFNSSVVQSAVSIPDSNQVRFTLDTGETLIYDYFFKQWGTFTGVPAVSSCIFEGLHTFINKYGQVYQENPGSYLDGSRPVLMRFTTGWLNFAGLRGYERVYEFSFLGQYFSPHKLSIQVAYDYGAPYQSTVYSPPNFGGIYGSDPLYGDSQFYGGFSDIENFRVFTKVQKCKAFQISVQEIFDPSLGVNAGAGFSLSGINCVIGIKKSYSPVSGRNSVG